MTSPDRTVFMVLESLFPTTFGGGAEVQVRNLGPRLMARGYGVVVIAPMVDYGPDRRRDRVDGVDVVRIPYPKIRLFGTVVLLCRLAWLLVRRRHEYGAIHAHIAHNMAAVCCVVGRLLGKPVVVKLTGMQEMTRGILAPGRVLSGFVQRHALKRATFYQATSSQIRQKLIERGFDVAKAQLIPNAVDTERFRPERRDPTLRRQLCGDARIVGVFVGRFVPEKGLENLLRVWARVFAPGAQAALVLVGEGALQASLKALAQALGIERQVVFAGHSDQVERYLAIADFAVLPSLNEGLSNSLLEYMASGLPVLGSRVSGTEDLVAQAQTGWLFEPGDERGLEHCLSQVATAPIEAVQAMGRNAHARVMRYASMDAVVDRLLQLYGMKAPAGAERT